MQLLACARYTKSTEGNYLQETTDWLAVVTHSEQMLVNSLYIYETTTANNFAVKDVRFHDMQFSSTCQLARNLPESLK